MSAIIQQINAAASSKSFVVAGYYEGQDYELEEIGARVESNVGPNDLLKVGYKFNRKTVNHPTVVLATPSRIDGIEVDEALIGDRLTRHRGLVGALFGPNLLFEEIASYDLGEQETIVHMPGVERTGVGDGPFFSELLQLGSIEALGHLGSKKWRPKFDTAIRFIDRSFAAEDRFLNLWIGLEILCGSNFPKMWKYVCATYALSRPENMSLDDFASEILRDFGLYCGHRTRNKYLHDGRTINCSPKLYRYYYLLFTDILSHRLGSAPQHLGPLFMKHEGIIFRDADFLDNVTHR